MRSPERCEVDADLAGSRPRPARFGSSRGSRGRRSGSWRRWGRRLGSRLRRRRGVCGGSRLGGRSVAGVDCRRGRRFPGLTVHLLLQRGELLKQQIVDLVADRLDGLVEKIAQRVQILRDIVKLRLVEILLQIRELFELRQNLRPRRRVGTLQRLAQSSALMLSKVALSIDNPRRGAP